MGNKEYYLFQAEKQRKLAVWAKRKNMNHAAEKHESNYNYFMAQAKQGESEYEN